MRKIVFLLTISCSILILYGCQPKEQIETENVPASQGDWPVYTVDELTNNSDLVAYVEVIDTKDVDGSPSSQESNLSVLKTLKGKATGDTIPLSLSEFKILCDSREEVHHVFK